MEQARYDFEEEDSDIGREEAAVPGNTATPSINSIMTSIWKMNSIMVNSLQADQDSLGLVDSGADTSMIGPEFYIEISTWS